MLNRRAFLRAMAAAKRRPNVVVMFLDDSGYADFHPFGKPEYATPNVERVAREGCRFTNFHVPQAICSASRSALLTGCFPCRTKMFGAHGPRARGVDPKFETMGQVFQRAGYKTAVFGKWHIGDQPETRPPARGFDESCGLMYSNDMWEFHPQNPEAYAKYPLEFWENGQVKIPRVTKEHQPFLTQWYTEHAVDFIGRHKREPFLLYVPHSMPHVPLFAGERFRGKSGQGLYADVMMEIDWSVGEIQKALKKNGVEGETIFLMTSDNGPWTSYGNHAGKTPFRESKGTSFEGGTRSACIVKYPGRIRAGGESARMWSTVDVLPTLATLAGVELPGNEIDGRDVWDVIRGVKDARNPHEYYAFSNNTTFEGVVSGDGRWKLHLPHSYRVLEKAGHDGAAGQYGQARIELSLFDMENDALETTNVIEKYPEVARRMMGYADAHRARFYQ